MNVVIEFDCESGVGRKHFREICDLSQFAKHFIRLTKQIVVFMRMLLIEEGEMCR